MGVTHHGRQLTKVGNLEHTAQSAGRSTTTTKSNSSLAGPSVGLWIADTDSESSGSMFLVPPHPPSHRDGCLLILTLYSDCDPNLFELALQLREKRLDIEEALVEEKKIVDNLKKEYDTFSKKVWGLPTCLSSNVLPTLLYHRRGIARTSQRRSISNVIYSFLCATGL